MQILETMTRKILLSFRPHHLHRPKHHHCLAFLSFAIFFHSTFRFHPLAGFSASSIPQSVILFCANLVEIDELFTLRIALVYLLLPHQISFAGHIHVQGVDLAGHIAKVKPKKLCK